MKKRILFTVILSIILILSIFGVKGTSNEPLKNERELLASRGLEQEKFDLIEELIVSADYKGLFNDVPNLLAGGNDISLPFDWSCENIDDRSFAYQMNGFLFLDYTYKMYVDTNNSEYKNLIISYMIDWVENNPEPLEGNEWAWHDDATARRVFRMSYYYFIWQNEFDASEKKMLLDSLAKQAELLNSVDFYTKSNNHGMFQDMGLISYSLLIADEDKKNNYLIKAKNRSQEYFNYVFTSDGVHKEHSPSYHINISQKLLFFMGVYKGIDDEFCNNLTNLYSNTSEYITQITMPDGTVPSIGDSARYKANIETYNNTHYLYAATQGTQGEEPLNYYISQEGGYASMRSSWKDSPDIATYILFMAATHSSTHKHGDDLSFLLYHKGDLFVESGSRDYNYKDEMTKYAYSGFGHNVLIVNNEAFPVKYGKSGSHNIYPEALKTKITEFDIMGDIKYVEGEQHRFEGILQKRKITYDTLNNEVLIDEFLKGKEKTKGTLIYHIAKGIDVKEVSNGWLLSKNGEEIALVTVNSDTNSEFNLSTIKNSEGNSPYYTWIFDGQKDPQIGSLLKIDAEVSEMDVDISLKINLR